ncbi:hypothetical protein SEA_FORZA_20 [Gordonia phage Forza]|uniref:Uncharacterized protein n=1 Tax=Gordonia phage Forza TaxID=2571247 RepID=A0A650EY51_9CAUD|nr:hypothetical protein PP303_gp020 [Gordonia phage Forza]QEM41489.1 hypothetical protein SEA_BOOPY_20 [Gordonia phage Boopy]QGT55013.1 hypothetical protein SEA_FORZA_20 [Gordonia phage Forza]UXE04162.1 hypothetical protein SEA_BLUENGOLD_18 [Gordonia phage BlueNGold]WBF03801.1 hypothetical protein SEA_MAREELIH_18 [Gordonia phage Mareelih]
MPQTDFTTRKFEPSQIFKARLGHIANTIGPVLKAVDLADLRVDTLGIKVHKMPTFMEVEVHSARKSHGIATFRMPIDRGRVDDDFILNIALVIATLEETWK